MEILSELSTDIPAAIVILLHMPLGSEHRLKNSLGRFTRVPIVSVESSERLQHGIIFVPPPGESAIFRGGMIIVDRVAVPERPINTINRLFASAAHICGSRVIGVILSGLLRDGTDGLRAVHEAGGLTIVQDPTDAEYPSMPTNAMEDLPVTFCLNLSDVGATLELLVRRGRQFETGLAVALRTLQARAALIVRLVQQSRRNPGTREFLVNELLLLNREIHSIDSQVKEALSKISGGDAHSTSGNWQEANNEQ